MRVPRALKARSRTSLAALAGDPKRTATDAVFANAAVGRFGRSTLAASTKALASSSPGDATYTKIENTLTALGNARDAAVAQLKAVLYGAEFGGGAQSPAAAAAAARAVARP